MSGNHTTTPLELPPMSQTKPPPPPPPQVPVMLSELNIGGSILLTISIIFIVVNAFLIFLILKNWSTVKGSRFFNSFFLGMVLSLTDFLFALLVGFPASLHLTWMTYFREQAIMRFYSVYIGHFVFEYIFLVRVLVIVLLSLDCFLHLQFPLRYFADYEFRKRVYRACGIVAAIPLLLRTLPSIVYFMYFSKGKGMECMVYKDPNITASEKHGNITKFYVPLTCAIFLEDGLNDVVKVDVIILATITISAWFTMATTSITSLLTVITKGYRRLSITAFPGPGSSGISFKQVIRSTFRTFAVIFTFFLTNFPYVCIWWIDYLSGGSSSKVTDHQRLYLTLAVFFSLVFHPWFFLFRMKSFRNLLKSFKKKISKVSSAQLTKTTLVTPSSSSEHVTPDLIYRNEFVLSKKQTTNIAQVTTPDPVSNPSEEKAS